jgi:hypothetical protein
MLGHAQPQRWSTPCRLSASAYSIYSHLLSISGDRLLHPQPEDAPCRGTVLPLLCLCKPWSLTLREENRLKVLKRIFGPKRGEVRGGWRKLHNEKLRNFYSSPNIFFSCGSTVLWDPGRLAYGRFLELFRHMVGLLGRVISPSQGLYLHRTTQHRKTRDKHPCLERNSNPRSQKPTGQDPRLILHGHCDRQPNIIKMTKSNNKLVRDM